MMSETEAKSGFRKWRLVCALFAGLIITGLVHVLFAEYNLATWLPITRPFYLYRNKFFVNSSTVVSSHAKNSSPIRVLLWTAYFGGEWENWPCSLSPSSFAQYCPAETRRKCEFTTDRSLYNVSDALVFHMRDSLNIPKEKRPRQQNWIFYLLESPTHTYVNLQSLQKVFNLTMTYRLDSQVPAPYGQFLRVRNQKLNTYDPLRNYAKGKTKLVAWFVSNCHTQSRREVYVRALQKYIDVHVYGKCGSYKCPRSRHNHCQNEILAKDYKFYLSFENSLCTDYITEKTWNALRIPIVPVVMGNANYKSRLPPNSFIDVHDFDSPKELAVFLHKVDKNDTLYNEYFRWKSNFEVTRDTSSCTLCEYLHKNRHSVHIVDNLVKFWSTPDNCIAPGKLYKGVNV